MTVKEKAYAKINLFLDVLGRRDDGFHEILSVMHSVDFCDIITLSCADSEKNEITLTTSDPILPTDEGNIAYRVAMEYLVHFNLAKKINIHIEKNIPIGAGLGGGSSDGAATLRALNNVLGLADRSELIAIAQKIGSDIPFCLFGGLYLCGGRGEKLKRLASGAISNYVIAIGEGRISTPEAYAELDKIHNNYVDYVGDDVSLMYRRMIIDTANEDGDAIPLYNAFERVIDSVEIDKIKKIMIKSGAEYALMSGTGPAVFGCFATASEAEKACGALVDAGYSAYNCKSVYPEVNI